MTISGDEFILFPVGVHIDECDPCLEFRIPDEVGEMQDISGFVRHPDGKVGGADEHEMDIVVILRGNTSSINGWIGISASFLVVIPIESVYEHLPGPSGVIIMRDELNPQDGDFREDL